MIWVECSVIPELMSVGTMKHPFISVPFYYCRIFTQWAFNAGYYRRQKARQVHSNPSEDEVRKQLCPVNSEHVNFHREVKSDI